MTKRLRLDLYLNTPALGIVQAADVVVVEEGVNLRQVGFRYRPDYLARPEAFALDPVRLPLVEGEKVLNCSGGRPAFIDDYLPDAWRVDFKPTAPHFSSPAAPNPAAG